jgi:hypothetical protein
MKKIVEIIEIRAFYITCRFNDGRIATINVKPLLESQQHLLGIEKLFDETIFKKVRIGIMGELVWENIITTIYNNETTIWDYDISPELVWSLNNSLLVT